MQEDSMASHDPEKGLEIPMMALAYWQECMEMAVWEIRVGHRQGCDGSALQCHHRKVPQASSGDSEGRELNSTMHPCPDQGWAVPHLCSRTLNHCWMFTLRLMNHLQIWRKLNLWHRQNTLKTIVEVSPEYHLWTPGRSFGAWDLDLPSIWVWQPAYLVAMQTFILFPHRQTLLITLSLNWWQMDWIARWLFLKVLFFSISQ